MVRVFDFIIAVFCLVWAFLVQFNVVGILEIKLMSTILLLTSAILFGHMAFDVHNNHEGD